MRAKRWILVPLVVLLLGAVVLAGCGDQQGRVSGQVNGPNGEPLARAEIAVYQLTRHEEATNMNVYQKSGVLLTETTDGDGKYSLSLEEGAYILQVLVNNQKVGDRLVNVTGGRATTVDFQVEMP